MSFFTNHLDPAEILGEILFGMIMVLTFTLGAAAAGGYERGLLLAAVGCNVAWGVIDAALFVLSSRYARRRRGSLVRAIHAARDEASALEAIRAEFEDGIQATTHAADRLQLYRSIHALLSRAEPLPMRLGGEDLPAAVAVFLLVSLTAVPAALPFFAIADPHLALRVSNWLMVALLFVVGWRWGRHLGLHPAPVALLMTAIGVALVVVAIQLGG
jgi:VIT1/CCC1 family predicted Fe2+/Mn2+ transporter